MAETVTPQAGDVWEHKGLVRFVIFHDGELITRSINDDYEFVEDLGRWFATAKRVFPPVPTQPDGETITVECAVMQREDGSIMLDGDGNQTGAETVASWTRSYRHIATVPVVIPKSLLSVPVLPAVPVTAETQP